MLAPIAASCTSSSLAHSPLANQYDDDDDDDVVDDNEVGDNDDGDWILESH